MDTKTISEVVKQLDDLDVSNPEQAHIEADRIVLECLPPEIKQAYEDLKSDSPWWAHS